MIYSLSRFILSCFTLSVWKQWRVQTKSFESAGVLVHVNRLNVMCFLFYSERGCVSVIRTLGWRIQIRLNSFVKWSLTSIMGHVVLYRFWVVLFQRSCFLMPTFSQLFSIKCSITGYTSFKVLRIQPAHAACACLFCDMHICDIIY